MSVIEKTIYLINELHAITEENRMHVDVNCYGKKEVHISSTVKFFSIFNQFDIEDRQDYEYPYKAVIEVEGVIFLTLLTQQEYEKYVLKSKERVG